MVKCIRNIILSLVSSLFSMPIPIFKSQFLVIIWLYKYMVIRLYGDIVIWLYGYLVIRVLWFFGYMVIRLYGYMDNHVTT